MPPQPAGPATQRYELKSRVKDPKGRGGQRGPVILVREAGHTEQSGPGRGGCNRSEHKASCFLAGDRQSVASAGMLFSGGKRCPRWRAALNRLASWRAAWPQPRRCLLDHAAQSSGDSDGPSGGPGSLAPHSDPGRRDALALQPGHRLLQVLHHQVHLSPRGAAAHAEPERVPGHVEGDAAAQQHWGRPAGARDRHQLSRRKGREGTQPLLLLVTPLPPQTHHPAPLGLGPLGPERPAQPELWLPRDRPSAPQAAWQGWPCDAGVSRSWSRHPGSARAAFEAVVWPVCSGLPSMWCRPLCAWPGLFADGGNADAGLCVSPGSCNPQAGLQVHLRRLRTGQGPRRHGRMDT